MLATPLSPRADAPAHAEIEALIGAVAGSGCTFIRNGKRHPAAAAAEHLKLKYRRGRRYADTAEHFIERLASRSSWSGTPYFIECEGVQQSAGDWLRRKLSTLRTNDEPHRGDPGTRASNPSQQAGPGRATVTSVHMSVKSQQGMPE